MTKKAQEKVAQYKARKNEVVDDRGQQVLVVFPIKCTKKLALELAALCADHLNRSQKGQSA